MDYGRVSPIINQRRLQPHVVELLQSAIIHHSSPMSPVSGDVAQVVEIT